MTVRRSLPGLGLFALLSVAVVFNAFYLQGMRPPRASGEPASATVADAQGPAVAADAGLAAPAARPGSAPLETVVAIQRELDQRGYAPGAANGSVTPVTRAAILAFELDQGLALTAEPSEPVLQALILGTGVGALPDAPSSVRPGPEAETLIRRVQRDLAALGYGPFQASGRLAEETTRAISRFERDQNMPVSGRVSAPLVARLMRVAPQEARRNPA